MQGFLRRLAVRLLPPVVTDALRVLLARARAARPVSVPAPSEGPAESPLAEPLPPAATPAPPPPAPPPPEPPEWEIVADTDEVWASLRGWDDRSVAATQIEKWADFKASLTGPGVLGQSHEATRAQLDLATHNTIVSFGYALARAGSGKKRMSILDWGGGIGHYFLYARALLPDVALDYTVKDLPTLCREGRLLLPEVAFVADDSVLASTYDFVFASSSVHYERDPYAALTRLAAASRHWLFVTRTPILSGGDDLLVVQRPYAYGYMTEYAGWMMNRERLVGCLEKAGFALERQFLIGEQPYLPMLEEPPQYYGFLFRRT
jgi:putative methyltransferase (TIGR04325 family)